MFKQVCILIILLFSPLGVFAQTEITLKTEGSLPLELVSMPKPGYTEAARKQQVKGSVTLCVVFLATGEIGEVSYLTESSKKKKKLTKYGLVEKAIEAAKKIKFNPAKDENGNPIHVTKTVQYNFNLL